MTESPDPDYRFTLANERTFLAWLRTSLALIAAGVAVVQLVPEFGVPGGRRAIGLILVGLGILVAIGGTRRWRQVQLAMANDDDLPRTRMPLLLGAALALLAIAVAVLLLAAP